MLSSHRRREAKWRDAAAVAEADREKVAFTSCTITVWLKRYVNCLIQVFLELEGALRELRDTKAEVDFTRWIMIELGHKANQSLVTDQHMHA